MTTLRAASLVAAILVAGSPPPAAVAASPACAPLAEGASRTVLAGVPSVISASMTPTRDGGAVVAFSSYRGSPAFPGNRVSVLALDASGCTRWRTSRVGGWPVAQPVQADRRSIVIAYAGKAAGGVGPLRIDTLSALTGKLIRSDRFGSLAPVTGSAPTLLADGRGNVAAVLATSEQSQGRLRPVTLVLSRRAGSTRWVRRDLARSNTAAPAAAVRIDGRMVVGYPRGGRFVVRTGSIVGRLGAPLDAGPISPNYRGSAVAIGADGTIAAVWEATTYGRPWRLRSAIRARGAGRFARSTLLGADRGRSGTLLTPAPAAAHVSSRGRVTVGFAVPRGTRGGQQLMCSSAQPGGQLDAPVSLGPPSEGSAGSALTFGRGGDAAAVPAFVAPAGDAVVSAVLVLGPGCRVRRSEPLAADAGPAISSAITTGGRIWVLGQRRGGVSARSALVLTVGR